MLMVAGELFRLTDVPTFQNLFEQTWSLMDNFGDGPPIHPGLPWRGSYSLVTQPVIHDHMLAYLGHPSADAERVALSDNVITVASYDALEAVTTLHAHSNGRDRLTDPSWGDGTAVGEHVIRIMAALQRGNLSSEETQLFFNALSLSADYVLGANPAGMVWITGLGSRSPQDPRHHDSTVLIHGGMPPIPGFPVYGPSEGIPFQHTCDYGKNVMYPAFEAHPLLRRYEHLYSQQ